MSNCAYWETFGDMYFLFFKHSLKKKHPCAIIREWEINLLVKKWLDILGRAIPGFTRASNKHNSIFRIEELTLLEILKWFLHLWEKRVHWRPFFLLSTGENIFKVIAVNNRRLEFLSNFECWVNHSVDLFLICVLSVDVCRWNIQ